MKLFNFLKSKPAPKSRKQPRLYVENNSFDKQLNDKNLTQNRLIGPRTDRLDGDFQDNLINTATINNDIRGTGDLVRKMSRTIAINTSYGKRAVQYQVDNVIGEGINPQPRLIGQDGKPNKKLNTLISDRFGYWAKNARYFSLNKRMNWRRFQELVERARFVDGEVFIYIREDDKGIKVQLIESARCKWGDRENTTEGYILDGIEYDHDNAPIRYHFKDIDQLTQTEAGQTVSYEASEIIHYYRELFVDQRRGIPEAVANIKTLNQYDAFTHATLVQKRSAASSMGFITQDKDGQESLDLGLEEDENETEKPEIIQDFEAGTIHKLPAGHDITQFQSTQGGDDFISFTDRLEDQLAMGYGFYKQGWKGDTAQINYSAARFGDQAQRIMFKSVQRNLKEQVFEVIFERWLEREILDGNIEVRIQMIPEILAQTVWTYPKWESIDPIKDSQKDATDVENGFVSAADVIISRGQDPDLVFAQIEQERNRYVPKYVQQKEVAEAPAIAAADAQVESAEISASKNQ